jgi:hypothetical protein
MSYDSRMRLRSINAWRWAWTAWAAGSAGSFFVLEAMALRRHLHPTLSTTMRRTLGVYPRTSWGRLALVAFAGFWTWLVVHIACVPDDVFYGAKPTEGVWFEVSPSLWYRVPRRKSLI